MPIHEKHEIYAQLKNLALNSIMNGDKFSSTCAYFNIYSDDQNFQGSVR